MSKSSSDPQKEINAYYAAKKPYIELLQKVLSEKKPSEGSTPKKYAFQTMDSTSLLSKAAPREMPNLEGLTYNYEAVAKAIADIRKTEEQEKQRSRNKR